MKLKRETTVTRLPMNTTREIGPPRKKHATCSAKKQINKYMK